MKDQFGVIWEKQEIVSTELLKDTAGNLAEKKNEEIFPGKYDYYKVVEMEECEFSCLAVASRKRVGWVRIIY
jgi:hypothetical protein